MKGKKCKTWQITKKIMITFPNWLTSQTNHNNNNNNELSCIPPKIHAQGGTSHSKQFQIKIQRHLHIILHYPNSIFFYMITHTNYQGLYLVQIALHVLTSTLTLAEIHTKQMDVPAMIISW